MEIDKKDSNHLEETQVDEYQKPVHLGVDELNRPRYDDKETIKILRKVDWRLMPGLTLLYLLGNSMPRFSSHTSRLTLLLQHFWTEAILAMQG